MMVIHFQTINYESMSGLNSGIYTHVYTYTIKQKTVRMILHTLEFVQSSRDKVWIYQ